MEELVQSTPNQRDPRILEGSDGRHADCHHPGSHNAFLLPALPRWHTPNRLYCPSCSSRGCWGWTLPRVDIQVDRFRGKREQQQRQPRGQQRQWWLQELIQRVSFKFSSLDIWNLLFILEEWCASMVWNLTWYLIKFANIRSFYTIRWVVVISPNIIIGTVPRNNPVDLLSVSDKNDRV